MLLTCRAEFHTPSSRALPEIPLHSPAARSKARCSPGRQPDLRHPALPPPGRHLPPGASPLPHHPLNPPLFPTEIPQPQTSTITNPLSALLYFRALAANRCLHRHTRVFCHTFDVRPCGVVVSGSFCGLFLKHCSRRKRKHADAGRHGMRGCRLEWMREEPRFRRLRRRFISHVGGCEARVEVPRFAEVMGVRRMRRSLCSSRCRAQLRTARDEARRGDSM